MFLGVISSCADHTAARRRRSLFAPKDFEGVETNIGAESKIAFCNKAVRVRGPGLAGHEAGRCSTPRRRPARTRRCLSGSCRAGHLKRSGARDGQALLSEEE